MMLDIHVQAPQALLILIEPSLMRHGDSIAKFVDVSTSES
jgi:hypothetical protein